MSETNLQFPLSIVITIVALIVVLIVAWLALRMLASINRVNPNSTKAVKVLQSTAVGTRERLVLVQYCGRDLLLGVTAGGITVLKDSSDNDHVEFEPSSGNQTANEKGQT